LAVDAIRIELVLHVSSTVLLEFRTRRGTPETDVRVVTFTFLQRISVLRSFFLTCNWFDDLRIPIITPQKRREEKTSVMPHNNPPLLSQYVTSNGCVLLYFFPAEFVLHRVMLSNLFFWSVGAYFYNADLHHK
jgi:hypothetical protein